MLGLDDTARTLEGLSTCAAGWACAEEVLAAAPAPAAAASRGELLSARAGFLRQVADAERANAIRARTARRLASATSGGEAAALLLPLRWADETRTELAERLGPEDAMRSMAATLALRLVEAARLVRATCGLDADAGGALAGWAECAHAAGLIGDGELELLSGSDFFAAQACAEWFAAKALPH